MAFVIAPSRNRVIQMAFDGLAKQYAVEEKAEPKAVKAKKPAPEPSKNVKPPHAKGGKPSKEKP